MLMENKKLQQLNIGFNKIGDDGVRHISEGLQQNDTLTVLSLQSCEITVKGKPFHNYILAQPMYVNIVNDFIQKYILASYLAIFTW